MLSKHLTTFKFYLHGVFNKHSLLTSCTYHLISIFTKMIYYLAWFVNTLVLPVPAPTSTFGFAIIALIAMQLLSGFFLAWYYIPEPGLVIELREEMFEETKYGYEVFNIHVRGVDAIFILSYFHILKKIYLKNYIIYESDGWLLGGYAFFWFHYVVGLGICLSASHLSDLTLTIAANIYWSLLNNTHKSYYFIFTNKHLNADELMRLMLLHYISPWYYIYLVQMHMHLCHEGWSAKSEKETYEDKTTNWISWFYDAFLKELSDSAQMLLVAYLFFFFHHYDLFAVHYFFFWTMKHIGIGWY